MLRMTTLLVVLVVGLFPRFAAAQQRTDSLASVLREAEQADWVVRATLKDSIRPQGRVQMGTGQVRVGDAEIALARVRLLERMRSGRGGVITGAKWGAGAGAVLGFVMTMACDGFDARCGMWPEGAVIIPASALMVGFLGGVIGGALDTSVRWDPIWPET